MTEDIHALIQAEIDGQNTPEASQQLADMCQADPVIQVGAATEKPIRSCRMGTSPHLLGYKILVDTLRTSRKA